MSFLFLKSVALESIIHRQNKKQLNTCSTVFVYEIGQGTDKEKRQDK